MFKKVNLLKSKFIEILKELLHIKTPFEYVPLISYCFYKV